MPWVVADFFSSFIVAISVGKSVLIIKETKKLLSRLKWNANQCWILRIFMAYLVAQIGWCHSDRSSLVFASSWGSSNCFFPEKSHFVFKCSVCAYPTFCGPVDCSLPGSSVHGIFQARILERVAISYSRGSSWPRVCFLCLLHWQADSLPLAPHGRPMYLNVLGSSSWMIKRKKCSQDNAMQTVDL